MNAKTTKTAIYALTFPNGKHGGFFRSAETANTRGVRVGSDYKIKCMLVSPDWVERYCAGTETI